MNTYLILILTFVLGMLVLASASADSPLVVPAGGDPQASIDGSNASVDEAPIVIAGAPRRQTPVLISCCNADGSCQVTRAARCTIQGGTPAPLECTEGQPTPDPVCLVPDGGPGSDGPGGD